MLLGFWWLWLVKMLAINILSSLCKRYLSAAVGCEFFFSFAYVMFLMIEVTVEHKRPNSSQIHSLLHFFGLFICFLYDYMFCIRTLFYKFCVGLGVWWMSLLAHKIMLCSKVSQTNASFSSTPLNWIPPSKHLNLWRKKKKLFLKKKKRWRKWPTERKRINCRLYKIFCIGGFYRFNRVTASSIS